MGQNTAVSDSSTNSPDSLDACAKAEILYAKNAWQGSYKSQQYLDSAFMLCPNMAKARHEKSVPFLKRGDYASWIAYLDEAIAIAPADFLDARAWCKAKFLHDYSGALADFKHFDSITTAEIKAVGDNNIYTWMGLCEYGLGNYQAALQFLDKSIAAATAVHGEDWVGLYDFIYRGNIKLALKDYQGALADFNKQVNHTEKLADAYYYRGIALHKLQNKKEAKEAYQQALHFFNHGYTMTDPYVEMPFKIYPDEVESALLVYKN